MSLKDLGVTPSSFLHGLPGMVGDVVEWMWIQEARPFYTKKKSRVMRPARDLEAAGK